MTTIQITDAATAMKFVRVAYTGKKDGKVRGSGGRTEQWWIEEAERVIEKWYKMAYQNGRVPYRFESVEDLIMDTLRRAKAKKGTFTAQAKCRICGAKLTAAESIAAGIGPECQMNTM